MERLYNLYHGTSLQSLPWNVSTIFTMERFYNVYHGTFLQCLPWNVSTMFTMERFYNVYLQISNVTVRLRAVSPYL
jgi:hypothetical protein